MVLNQIKQLIVLICTLIYRKFIKFFIRKITGKHEIERLLDKGNFEQIINCLLNSSKMTNDYKILINKVLYNKKIGNLNDDSISQSEVGKFISLSSYFSTVKKLNIDSRQKLYNFFLKTKFIIIDFKNKLLSQTNEMFDCKNTKHTDLLFRLWDLTYKSYPIETIYHTNKDSLDKETKINVIDDKWMWIGFQAKSPETDFRSTGILGLDQLVKFAAKSDHFNQVYSTALDKKMWYFWAAAGINITGKIRNYLFTYPMSIKTINSLFSLFDNKQDRRLIDTVIASESRISENESLLEKNITNKLFTFTDSLYSELFNSFNEMWKKQTEFNFMNFNSMFERFINENMVMYIEKLSKSSKVEFF